MEVFANSSRHSASGTSLISMVRTYGDCSIRILNGVFIERRIFENCIQQRLSSAKTVILSEGKDLWSLLAARRCIDPWLRSGRQRCGVGALESALSCHIPGTLLRDIWKK